METLFSDESGAGDEVIVLVHGFAGTHRAWAQIVPALATHHRVIAYDLPGHGASIDYPDAGPAKVAARAILADLAARGIARAHFAGHSMGGAVATLAAAFEPSRVASLSLLSPGGFGPEINQRLLARFAAASDETTVRLCLEGMFGWNSPVPEETVADALAQARDPVRRRKLIDIAGTLARDGVQGQIPREMIEALAMPVQLVWGLLDNLLPSSQAQGLPGRFRLHLLPGIGHMLPDEAPETVARLIEDLVQNEK